MSNIRGSELIILVLVVLVLFGAKKLPEAARGLGRSMRIFKAETKGLIDDDGSTAGDASDGGAPAAAPAVSQAQQAPAVAPAQPTPAVAPAVQPAPAVNQAAQVVDEVHTTARPDGGAQPSQQG